MQTFPSDIRSVTMDLDILSWVKVQDIADFQRRWLLGTLDIKRNMVYNARAWVWRMRNGRWNWSLCDGSGTGEEPSRDEAMKSVERAMKYLELSFEIPLNPNFEKFLKKIRR